MRYFAISGPVFRTMREKVLSYSSFLTVVSFLVASFPPRMPGLSATIPFVLLFVS